MAKEGYLSGDDAAYIKPKFVPNTNLTARDDSGGPEYDPRTAQFGDGYEKEGEKSHLSASGGKSDPILGTELDDKPRTENRHVSTNVSSRSKKEAME